MIKVCHITSAHQSTDTRIFSKECCSLVNAGYEVYLVAEGKRREEKGVHIIGMGEIPNSRIRRMTFFSKKVYKCALELDCDIYHIHDPELLRYAIKLKRMGKKVIFDSHENTLEQMEEKEWIPSVLRKIISVVYKYYATKVFSNMDFIISVTPHICDKLKAINPNVVQITNYPILKNYPTKNRGNKKTTICFAGGVSEQWCHSNIMKALYSQKGKIKYDVFGSISNSYLDKLNDINKFEVLNYCGVVKHDTINDILSEYACGMAICSYNKNMGGLIGSLGNTKLFEYMMAGIPVICTDFVLWKEIINEYECGICVNPNSVSEIEAAIVFLVENPIIAEEMGRNGRIAVEKMFSWKTQEKKLLELYKTFEF